MMKHIFIVSLAVMAMQIVLNEARPTTAPTQPPKDAITDFLLQKLIENKAASALVLYPYYTQLFQNALEYFESKKGAEHIDSQTMAALKGDLLLYKASVEAFKKDKYKCSLLRDMTTRGGNLKNRIRALLLPTDAEPMDYWMTHRDMPGNLIDELNNKLDTEIAQKLPQIIVKYKANLNEAEKRVFEGKLNGSDNIYAGLFSIYDPKGKSAKDRSHAAADVCDDFDIMLEYLYYMSTKIEQ